MLQKNNYRLNYFNFTPICNNFIDNYIKNTNPSFVVIYIYILKETFINKKFKAEDIATALNILQADVLTALKFWEEKGLITYELDERNNILVEFFDFNHINNLNNTRRLQIKSQERPNYTQEELEGFSKEEEVAGILKMAERIFCKTFNYTDRNIIIGLHEWLGLSPEVLAVLFTYCANNSKTKLRYIEKVAIDWSEMGITSATQAEEYIKMHKKEFRNIMSFFGVNNREPLEEEQKFMKHWILDLKMPLELIKEACFRTIKNTEKISFKYANKILESWNEKKIKTLEEVKQIDKEYEKTQNLIKREEKKESTNNLISQNKKGNFTNNVKTNRFINYKQESYDFDKLRERELERLKERANQ